MDKKIISVRSVKQEDMTYVIDLLQSLSKFKPAPSKYSLIWDRFNRQSNTHSLVAIIKNEIVGYGSIIIEAKIRGGKVGHIEDIVSHKKYRNQGIGKKVLNALYKIAKKNNCYKIILQCKEKNLGFYQNNHYEENGISMQRFIKIL
jgi:glucosamine-phosphate N-acetyltransferase